MFFFVVLAKGRGERKIRSPGGNGAAGEDGTNGEDGKPVQLMLLAYNEFENSLVLSGSVTDKIQFARPDGIILACTKGGDAGCGGEDFGRGLFVFVVQD